MAGTSGGPASDTERAALPATEHPRHYLKRRSLERLLPPLAYLLGAVYMSSPFLAHPTRGVPGGPDGTVYVWFFQWAEYCLVHLHNPFVSNWLNAPDGLNPMWNGSMFVVAIVCIPLTATLGATVTTGIVIMLAPALAATAAYFAVRSITGGSWGPALCASLYGFGPFFVGQNVHVHLSLAVFPPLLLMLSHQLTVRQDQSPVRSGVWLGLVVAGSLLTTEEVVALTTVVAVVAGVALAIFNPREVPRRFRHAAVGFGVGAAVAVAITAIPLAYQFFGPQALVRGVGIHNQRQDLAGLVRPNGLMHYASPADIAANSLFPATEGESTGYLGWPLIALPLLTCGWLAARRDRFAYWWLATTVAAVSFSLGTEITYNGRDTGRRGPWSLLDNLPALNGAIPVRFSLLTTLLVALVLARGIATLRGRAAVIGLVVIAAALIPLRPAHRYVQIRPVQTPRFFTTSAVQAIPAGATALLLPIHRTPDGEEPSMVWQIKARLRFKIIGGYGVFNANGNLDYLATSPLFATVLTEVGDSGVRPAAATLDAARRSVAPSGAGYIVITRGQQNAQLVGETARELTGCDLRQASDVVLCAFQPG